MPGPVFQAGERVSLHTVEEEDLDLYARAHADPDIRIPLTIDGPENREVLEERFEEDISDDGNVHLLACLTEAEADETDDDANEIDDDADDTDAEAEADDADDGPTAIGSVIFTDVYESAGMADLAYWLLPEYQGEGYGSEALSLMLEYGFDELRLHRVQADCLASNDASRGLLESHGFEQEGVFRDAQFVDGEYVDVLRYGLLADEWGGA